MKQLLLFLSFAFLTQMNHSYSQRTIAGVSFKDKVVTSKGILYFNGAGLREKYTIDLYVSALYLKNQTIDGSKVTNNDEAMSITIVLVSKKVTRDKFTSSVEEGFEKSAGSNLSKLRDRIDEFKELLSESFSIDDKIELIYLPGLGTQVKKNSKLLGTIKGLDFKRALFGIWFGSNPADAGLKDDMLGRL